MGKPLVSNCQDCGKLIAGDPPIKPGNRCGPCYRSRRAARQRQRRLEHPERFKVQVYCKDCGKALDKWRENLTAWQGHCNSCAQRFRYVNPAVRLAASARARAQVLAQGGIPNRGKNACRGAAVNTWKGGITPEHQRIRSSPAYQAWARAVKEEDDFICQFCGQRGGNLVSHHIRSFADYPELRFDIGNGMTLCKPCHFRYHEVPGHNRSKKP